MRNEETNQELVCPHCGFREEMTDPAILSQMAKVACLKCGQIIRSAEGPTSKRTDMVSDFGNKREQRKVKIMFTVKFQTFKDQDNRFAGTGSLKILEDKIEVSARRRRPFAFGRVTETHPIGSVRNVTRSGGIVSFVLPLAKGEWQALLVFPDEWEAAKLEGLLPSDKDPTYCSIAEARKELKDRLAELPGKTPAVWGILALNCLIYIVTASAAQNWFGIKPGTLVDFGGNFSPLTTEGEWWRMITAAFLHGGFIHLAFNMYALYVFGVLVERLYGTSAFLGMYLLSGLAGSAGTLIGSPASVGVGASGAIFGIMGALCVFLYTDRKFLSEGARKKLLTNFAIYATYALLLGFGKSGIDNAAHIGGLLSGLLLGVMSGTPLRLCEEKSGWFTGRVVAGICTVMLGIALSIAVSPRLGPEYRIYIKLQELTGDLGKRERALSEMAKSVAEKKDNAGAEDIENLKKKLRTTYDGLEERLDSMLPKTKGLQARRDLLRSYIALKKESCMLFLRSFDGENQQLLDQAKEKAAEANKMIEEMKKPIVWYK